MLQRRQGRWFLDDRPLENGDLVEVRGLTSPQQDPGHESVDMESWYPAIVFDDGSAVELEDATDPGWSRSARRHAIDLDTLARSTASIRRREATSRADEPTG
jgi:hypothetical protein